MKKVKKEKTWPFFSAESGQTPATTWVPHYLGHLTLHLLAHLLQLIHPPLHPLQIHPHVMVLFFDALGVDPAIDHYLPVARRGAPLGDLYWEEVFGRWHVGLLRHECLYGDSWRDFGVLCQVLAGLKA